MRDAVERLRQPPVRESVRAVSLMNNRQGRFYIAFRKVGIVREQLPRHEHSLVQIVLLDREFI